MSIYNENFFNEIDMTEAEFDKQAAKVTVKGYRLTYEEKQAVMYYIAMNWIENTNEAKEEIVLRQREDKAKWEQTKKNIKKMAKAAEDYAVKEIGWNRKEFKNTYNMYRILLGNLEVTLDYWEAYGEKGGAYYFRTYV